jgi:hypothetical protein
MLGHSDAETEYYLSILMLITGYSTLFRERKPDRRA